MANIKDVSIEGVLPWDMNGHDEMTALLGQLNMPVSGIRIEWGAEFIDPALNEHGGHEVYYDFKIRGQDSVSWQYLDRLVRVIHDCGGKISTAKAKDIENPGGYVDLTTR